MHKRIKFSQRDDFQSLTVREKKIKASNADFLVTTTHFYAKQKIINKTEFMNIRLCKNFSEYDSQFPTKALQ